MANTETSNKLSVWAQSLSDDEVYAARRHLSAELKRRGLPLKRRRGEGGGARRKARAQVGEGENG